jgi:PAS domain S-box-containing protein
MKHDKLHAQAELRSRAVARLSGPSAEPKPVRDPSVALGVLYQLAASPATAPGALALLHELQVHQVEVDLQDEELRRSLVELEANLNRQTQRYEHAPAGYYVVDRGTVMGEVNLAGARLLGFERDFLLGRALEGFLTPESGLQLNGMLERLGAGASGDVEVADLQLLRRDAATRRVHASARRDPAGDGFLIALLGAAKPQPA